MKFGVIGEPCIDYIHREGQETTKHLGGILYSVVSLAIIADKCDEIYPIMNLGDDEHRNVISFLSAFDNIRLDYVYKSAHSTRIVKLFYKTGNENAVCRGSTYDREESSTEPAPPLTLAQINTAAVKLDGLLVNMVSGKDLELGTLRMLRNEYKGYIHMDIHNIVMRTGEDGSRFRGPVKEWFSWCSNCDTLQMNEEEMSSISGDKTDENKLTGRILDSGKVKAVIVTRGNRGITIFAKSSANGAKKPDRKDLPAIVPRFLVDSTGCGDVFASAFFYRNLRKKYSDLLGSANYANILASRNSELNGVEELKGLL